MTPLARLLSLRVDLRDEAAAAEVTPEALAAYCVARGWAFALSTPALDVHRRDATSLAEIHVPRDPSADGYGRAVQRAIDRLAEHEGRSPLAVWADLVGLAPPEPTRADALPGRFTWCFTEGAADPRPWERPEPAQGVLPGVPAPTRPRRRAVHRWGVIAPETLPPDPLDPERPHVGLVQRCPHCTVLRRLANTGPRLGAEAMFSTDGGHSWSYANPACVMKD